MATKDNLDLTGLTRLNTEGLSPASETIDLSGLTPLDVSGLTTLDGAPADKSFSLGNTARLVAERAGDVAGNFVELGPTIANSLDNAVPLPALVLGRSRNTLEKAGVDPAFYIGDRGFGVASHDEKNRIRNVESHFLNKASDALNNFDFGGEEGEQRTWEEVKQNPISNVLPFILEQGIVSTPDMLAAIYATPAYIASRSQEIGGERAANDGRQEPTLGDVVEAAPAAVASALLERFGGRGVLGLDEVATTSVKQIAPAVGKAAVKEGATEFAQSIIENAGATVATERGFNPSEALDEGVAGMVAGSGFGGMMRAGTATAELASNRHAAPAGETNVEGEQLETLPTNVSEDDVASPIPTDIISVGRTELDAVNGTEPTPMGAGTQPTPTELETLFDDETGEAIGHFDPNTGQSSLNGDAQRHTSDLLNKTKKSIALDTSGLVELLGSADTTAKSASPFEWIKPISHDTIQPPKSSTSIDTALRAVSGLTQNLEVITEPRTEAKGASLDQLTNEVDRLLPGARNNLARIEADVERVGSTVRERKDRKNNATEQRNTRLGEIQTELTRLEDEFIDTKKAMDDPDVTGPAYAELEIKLSDNRDAFERLSVEMQGMPSLPSPKVHSALPTDTKYLSELEAKRSSLVRRVNRAFKKAARNLDTQQQVTKIKVSQLPIGATKPDLQGQMDTVKFENASSASDRELKSRVAEEDVKNRLRVNEASDEKVAVAILEVNDEPVGALKGLASDGEKQLRSHFRKLGLNNRAALFFPNQISQELDGAKFSANGRFVQVKKSGALFRIVEVAQDAPDKVHTLNHESIHVLRSIGAFNTSEWSALKRAARNDEALMQRIERLYAEQKLSEESLIEEAVADMFADWMQGRSSYKGFIRQAFERLRSIFEGIREAVTGTVNAQSVLRNIESGGLGRRKGNASMVEVSEETKSDSRQIDPVLQKRKELREFIAEAKTVRDRKVDFTIGLVDELQARNIADLTGIDVSGFKHKLDNYSIRHILKQHGDAKAEAARGQEPVTDEDIARIPEILSTPDIIKNAGKTKIGRDAILYEKEIDGVLYLIEEVRKGKQQLVPTTMWKMPRRVHAQENPAPPLKRPERLRSDTSISEALTDFNNSEGGEKSAATSNVEEAKKPEKFQKRSQANVGPADFSIANKSVWEHLNTTQLDAWQRIRAATTPMAVAESFDRLRANIQDSMMPLLRTQRRIEGATGTPLDERSDTYLHHKLMTGRVGARLEQLQDTSILPLFTEMQKLGVTQDELETYLYARHAQERNAYISKVNDKFRAGEGSGMTDADAKAILDAVSNSKKKPALETLAANVDSILDDAMNSRVEAGLLSEQEAKGLRARWKHYVPLRGEADMDPAEVMPSGPVQSKGITVNGKEYRHAFGRKSRASDILPYIFMQAQEGIIRGEKNRVAQSFVKLVEENENKDFWEVQKITLKPHLDKKTGQVRYVAQNRVLAEDANYTVIAKFGGVEKRVTLNRKNPHAVRLAEAMRNLGAQELGGWVRAFGKVNRWLSMVNTSLNPEFVISNAFRDLQTGLINVRQHDVSSISSKVFKDYPAALKASLKANFGKGEGDWQKWHDEYVSEGGRVYFNMTDDLLDMRRKLEAVIKRAEGKPSPIRIAQASLDIIGRANQGIESAVRLAAYKNLREAGFTKMKAAAAAKGLTVDFNVKGKFGPFINSLYLFANASIQGSVTLLSAAKRSAKVRRALALMVGLGAVSEVLNQMLSAVDDDDEKYYDKIPEYEKSRNLIIMIPGSDKYAKMPLPYGANAFTHVGRAMVELMAGKRNSLDVMADLTTTTVDAFNPMGGSNNFLNFIAPTIVDPLIDIERNRNFADRPIMPEENPFGHKGPDSQRKFNSVNSFYADVASGLNSFTGGDEVQPGAIDVSPETIEYLVGTAFGAMADFFGRTSDLPLKLLDKTKPLTANDIPIVRKVVGQKSDWLDRNAFYSRWNEIETLHNQHREYQKRGDEDKADDLYNDFEPLFALRTYARKTKARLKRCRDLRLKAEGYLDAGEITKTDYETEILSLQKDEQEVITEFNRDFVAALQAMQ